TNGRRRWAADLSPAVAALIHAVAASDPGGGTRASYAATADSPCRLAKWSAPEVRGPGVGRAPRSEDRAVEHGLRVSAGPDQRRKRRNRKGEVEASGGTDRAGLEEGAARPELASRERRDERAEVEREGRSSEVRVAEADAQVDGGSGQPVHRELVRGVPERRIPWRAPKEHRESERVACVPERRIVCEILRGPLEDLGRGNDTQTEPAVVVPEVRVVIPAKSERLERRARNPVAASPGEIGR